MTEDSGVAAWAALLRTHAAVVRALEHELEQTQNMPLAWYDVLLELNSAPDRRLRMAELGERAVLSRSRVSRIVDELARAGLAAREPDPNDRRGSWAVITDAGRARLRAAAPGYLDGIARHFADHLTAQERAAITTGLTRVLDAAAGSDAAARR
ncbi:MarR family winged helix-turn-helix transcriptional regulator [Pseudonocardia dioxanivorans]|uniref:MarR family winged helix-turn-helix transcriptional regulator n=1 Tax=Pseudonocardia dioxanivorans TaxID=240495 RepID=UPI000311A072|nr:MarR family transcriptional regulator [Pseudonocardia dioxanivorans]